MPASLRSARRAARTPAILAAVLLACGGDPTSSPAVGDIVVEPGSLTLDQHRSASLDATVLDGNGNLLTGVAVGFESGDEEMVTVSKEGIVTSVGPAGRTEVIVRAGTVTRRVPVTVNAVGVAIRVTPADRTIQQKGMLQLEAVVVDRAGDAMPGRSVEFLNHSPTLVNVTAAGLVSSIGPSGSGLIRVRSGPMTTEVPVTVVQVLGTISVSPSTLALSPGAEFTLQPSGLDLMGVPMPQPGTFTFSSSDEAVTTVGQDGTVRAAGALGEATITIGNGGVTAAVTVRVKEDAPPVGTIAARIDVPGAFGVRFGDDGTAYAVALRRDYVPVSKGGVYRLDLDAARATWLVSSVSGLDLALTPDGARAYVANNEAGRVDLIDLHSGEVLASSGFLTASALTDVLTEDGQTLWVGTGSRLDILDATTLALEQSLDVGAVIHLARHPTQPLLYASGRTGQVYEIDMASRSVLRTFVLGGLTQGVAPSPDGSRLYVADEAGSVRIVDLASGAEVGSIPLPGGGYGIVASPDGSRLYVTLPQANTLAIVEPHEREVLTTLVMDALPRRLALGPDGTVLLVAGEFGGVYVVR